jgi:Domain of unknown function (DUF4340)
MPVRRLLVALLAVVLLGGAVWWSNRHKKAEESKPAAAITVKVLAVPEDQVAQLEFQRKDAQPAIVKKNGAGKWEITAPKTLPADADAVQNVTSTLTSLTADQVVDEKPSDLGQFGLKDPSVRLIVTKKDGKTSQLDFGDETQTSGLVYAKVAGDPKVYALSTSMKSSLDKTWQDLRDKRLLTFNPDKLSRLELTAKKQTVELGRNAQNEWQIVKPKPYRADGFQAEELIRKVKDAKLDPAVSDEDAKKAASAFSSGTAIATVKVTDASGTQTLDVRKNKDDYYAKSSVVDGVFKVSNDLGTGLDKGLDDLRNKKLFDFGFSDPNKFTANGVAYSKTGEKWFANGKEMDNAGIQQFIDKARDLQAARFVEAGFTTPVFELVITSNEGKRTERVQISKTGDKYHAKRENEPAMYELDAKAAEDLIKGASAIKPAKPAPSAKK